MIGCPCSLTVPRLELLKKLVLKEELGQVSLSALQVEILWNMSRFVEPSGREKLIELNELVSLTAS